MDLILSSLCSCKNNLCSAKTRSACVITEWYYGSMIHDASDSDLLEVVNYNL